MITGTLPKAPDEAVDDSRVPPGWLWKFPTLYIREQSPKQGGVKKK